MSFPTASAMDRVMECPASAVLPQAKDTSEAAEKGRAIHTFLETGEAPEGYEDICSGIDRESLPTELDCEVALAYDLSTGKGRVLGKGLARAEAYKDRQPYEVVGTADVLGRIDKDTLYLADYKTGHGDIPRARASFQLRTLALAACKALGATKAVVEIIVVHEGRAPWHDRAELDIFDLDMFAHDLKTLGLKLQELRELQGKKGGAALDTSQGGWCRYCPAVTSCPARTALIVELTGGSTGDKLTRSTAAVAYHKLRMAENMLTRIRKVLMAMAEEEPLDLGGGKKLGMVTKPGNERLDGDSVYETAMAVFGKKFAGQCFKRTSSKAEILRAFKARKPDGFEGSNNAGVKQLVDAVRAAGGISRKPTRRVEEY